MTDTSKEAVERHFTRMGPSPAATEGWCASLNWDTQELIRALAAERDTFSQQLTTTRKMLINTGDECDAMRKERDALQARLTAARQDGRNDGLREAAAVCDDYSENYGEGMFDVHSNECSIRILALIKEPKP